MEVRTGARSDPRGGGISCEEQNPPNMLVLIQWRATSKISFEHLGSLTTLLIKHPFDYKRSWISAALVSGCLTIKRTRSSRRTETSTFLRVCRWRCGSRTGGPSTSVRSWRRRAPRANRRRRGATTSTDGASPPSRTTLRTLTWPRRTNPPPTLP